MIGPEPMTRTFLISFLNGILVVLLIFLYHPETIHKAEDRQAFKDTMEKIGEPCIPSKVVETVDDAVDFAAARQYGASGTPYPSV